MHITELNIKHLPNAVDSSTVDQILSKAKTAPRVDAEIAHVVDGEYVKVKDTTYCNASLVDYSQFSDLTDSLIKHCANLVKEKFKLTCVDQTVEFVHYTTGTQYWPHMDGQCLINENTLSRGNVRRDITCIVYLNEDYQGGELYFSFFPLEYRFKAGDIIMYPSNWPYMHGVKTVTGERYAFVIWFETSPHAYTMDNEVITDIRSLHILRSIERG